MKQAPNDRFLRLFYYRRCSATLVAVFLSCIVLLSACGGSNAAPNTTGAPTKKGGNIDIGLIAEPTTLDPLDR